MAARDVTVEVEGWVIVALNAMWPGASYATFGRTVEEAWSRHVGQHQTLHDMHQAIMNWTERGYAPCRAKLTIEIKGGKNG